MTKKVADGIIAHPERCSLKRAAWAYGCSKAGSDEEGKLLDVLVAKFHEWEQSRPIPPGWDRHGPP